MSRKMMALVALAVLPALISLRAGVRAVRADPISVFVNEIHYDNDGADVAEGVEIAGPAGVSLAGWELVLYNGHGGAAYATATLDGVLADQAGGFGVLFFPVSGLQNGAPDGLALVDAGGEVVQFLSYEGRFTAADGPAAGLESQDIGVAETTTTPAGSSLQLAGAGAGYEAFQWQAPAPSSYGEINHGQTFADQPNQPPVADAGGPYTAVEGTTVQLAGGGVDPEGGSLSYAWDLDDDGAFETPGRLASFVAAEGPASQVVVLEVRDDGGETATERAVITIDNAAAVVGPIVTGATLLPVATELTATAVFTDPGVLDTHSGSWDWGDGMASPGVVTESGGRGRISGSHRYDGSGVYTLHLSVMDDDGEQATATFRYLVVYDRSGAFVTGAGAFISPMGAYAANPDHSGPVSFGLAVRYREGLDTPQGKFEVQLPGTPLTCRSRGFDWLLVAEARAATAGACTLADGALVNFLVTAVDGRWQGRQRDADFIRIRLQDKASGQVLYDSQPGDSAGAPPLRPLDSGKLVIHQAR